MRFRLVLLSISLALPLHVAAQSSTSGGLIGVVTDPSEAVVPNAYVELQNRSKGTVQTKNTNSGGEYSFSFVEPGAFTLTVTHPGFQTVTQTVDISLGMPITVNVRLLVAESRTTMRVTDEEALIHAETGDASSVVSHLQVAELPNPGNDLTYIAQTVPGAIMNTDVYGSGNFSILGMPGTSNMFTVNGMTYTNLGTNVNMTSATNLLLGVNAVQEATVVSNGYSGRFGTLAGAEVNYITKSGSDEFHGNALYFWNGSVLNANDWINNATGTKRPFDNANQWAGSLGGPIKKDKLFFFFDAEGLDFIVPSSQQVVLPSPQFEAATLANIEARFGSGSASDIFYKKIFALYNGAPGAASATTGSFADPLGCAGFVGPNGLGTTTPCAVHFETTLGHPTYDLVFSGRVDWNIRPADGIFLSLAHTGGHQASYIDPISPLFNSGSDQPWWQGQLVETHSFGPSAVNQFVSAGWYIRAFGELDHPSEALTALPTQVSWDANGAFTNVGTSSPGRGGFAIAQYQLSDDFVRSVSSHKLGFGLGLIRHDLSNLNSVDAGSLIPLTLDAFYQGGFDPASPGDFTLLSQSFSSRLFQRIAYYDLSFYAQDEWHARSNFTLTLALRTEHESNPVCQRRCFARVAGSFDSVSHDPNQPYNQAIRVNLKRALEELNSIVWAPRLSFAWQPWGVSHNTVVRGGIGIFYNTVPALVTEFSDDNPPLVNHFFLGGNNLAPNETTNLFNDAASSNTAFLNGFAAGQTLPEIQANVNGFSPPSLFAPDRLKSAQYQKWSLELQQSFGSNTSASIGYFGNHGIHEPVQNNSANAFGFGTLPAAVCTSPPVPPCSDPRFAGVTVLSSTAISNYNGMVVSLQHRSGSSGILQVSYTYGHAFDEVSNGGLFPFTIGSSIYPQDPNNLRGSYGPADYDVRHSVNANYVWEVPVKAVLRGHGSNYLVSGWQVSGTIFARTGFPYSVFDNFEANSLAATNNFGGPIYAVPGGPISSGRPCGKGAAIPESPEPCQPPQVLPNGNFNPGASFIQAGCETGFNTGTLPGAGSPCGGPSVAIAQGRNRFRGPGYVETDFAIMKNTRIRGWEKGELGIGVRFFNLFNHPNFGLPINSISDPAFGHIFYLDSPPTGILGSALGGDASPRNIQLKVQLRF